VGEKSALLCSALVVHPSPPGSSSADYSLSLAGRRKRDSEQKN
jgi:hypothetical protein